MYQHAAEPDSAQALQMQKKALKLDLLEAHVQNLEASRQRGE
jgi:hypothetical protein